MGCSCADPAKKALREQKRQQRLKAREERQAALRTQAQKVKVKNG